VLHNPHQGLLLIVAQPQVRARPASPSAADQDSGRFHLVRSSKTWIGTDGAPLVYDDYDKHF
jgi:hypothetical protein